MYRNTYALINKKSIGDNIKEITSKYKYSYYFGVVKNNAYHHGIEVIDKMIENGINYLAVSSLDEAIDIRKINKDIPILILEPVDIKQIDIIKNNNITITIESLEYTKNLIKENINSPIKIHIKIDSGMNRLGFKNEQELLQSLDIIKDNENIILEGIYTHLATTGIYDYYYDKQINKFLDLTKQIDLKTIPIVHVDRSLTFVTHEKLPFVNGIRLGICMYGFSGSRLPDNSLKGKIRDLKRNIYLKKHNISKSILTNNLNLNTAYNLYTEVMSIRIVKKDEFVGYNAQYIVKEDGYIATLPIGYGDGITKDFQYVYINNKKYNIVADCMDMIMIQVDNTIKVGDTVEIIGNNNTIKSLSNRLGINAYHLFNLISDRVTKKYIDK